MPARGVWWHLQAEAAGAAGQALAAVPRAELAVHLQAHMKLAGGIPHALIGLPSGAPAASRRHGHSPHNL